MRAFALVCAGLLACGGGGAVEDGELLQDGSIKVQQVLWNGQRVDVGQVAGVAEVYEDLAVFSDRGVQVFTSGALSATDSSVKSWRGAAVIPAGDLSGDWAVGVSGDGRLLRLKNRSALEDVTDRYGLRGTALSGVAALGQGMVGLTYDKGLAVADGMKVTRYDGAFAGLRGGAGRVVVSDAAGVRVFAPAEQSQRSYALPDVVGAAFDPAGHLLVATRDALYQEEGADLRRRYRAGQPIRALAGGPSGVWLALGDGLALVSGQEVRRGPAGALPQGALSLQGSPSGDVWVLAGGALSRYEEDDGGGADKDLWRQSVLPIYTRLCAVCHLPGGSSGIDLSTYDSWAKRRALTTQRVVQGKPTPMPPAGAGALTAQELTDLKAWIANQP